MSFFNIGVRKILKWQIFCITVNNILYKLYAYVLLVTTTMRLTMEHGMSVIIQLPVLNAVLIPSQYMQSWPCQSVHVQASFSQRQDYLFALIQTYPLALLWHTRGKVSGQSPVVPCGMLISLLSDIKKTKTLIQMCFSLSLHLFHNLTTNSFKYSLL